jgi:hypothetical protein
VTVDWAGAAVDALMAALMGSEAAKNASLVYTWRAPTKHVVAAKAFAAGLKHDNLDSTTRKRQEGLRSKEI